MGLHLRSSFQVFASTFFIHFFNFLHNLSFELQIEMSPVCFPRDTHKTQSMGLFLEFLMHVLRLLCWEVVAKHILSSSPTTVETNYASANVGKLFEGLKGKDIGLSTSLVISYGKHKNVFKVLELVSQILKRGAITNEGSISSKFGSCI